MSFRALNRDIEKVLIFDLLSAQERKDWHLSEDLRKHLAKIGIPQLQMDCFTKANLFLALDKSLEQIKDSNFMLHFTAHGNADGIGISTTKEFVKWSEFGAGLRKINHALNGDLIVNMIACLGIEGIKIQDLNDPKDPFFGIVGPTIKIAVDTARNVCETFYNKMLAGTEVPTIVGDINSQLGSRVLWCESSQLRRNTTTKDLSV